MMTARDLELGLKWDGGNVAPLDNEFELIRNEVTKSAARQASSAN